LEPDGARSLGEQLSDQVRAAPRASAKPRILASPPGVNAAGPRNVATPAAPWSGTAARGAVPRSAMSTSERLQSSIGKPSKAATERLP
jgi:hypothetical protein